MTDREFTNRKRRLIYAERRDTGLCVRCGKELGEDDELYCARCKSLVALYKTHLKRDYKDRYRENKENGICVRCHKRPARPGRTNCIECTLRQKRYDAERNAKRNLTPKWMRGDGVHCTTCLKPVETPGAKLCNRCLANSHRACEIMRERRTNRGKIQSDTGSV